MQIVRPDGDIAEAGVQLSALPAAKSLSVGILDNRKDNAGRLLAGIRAQIVSRMSARLGAVFQKSYVNIPATTQALLGLSETSKLVLIGSGD
jgi:hypothetical protein